MLNRLSLPGLTRQSILFARRWMRGSSPRMTVESSGSIRVESTVGDRSEQPFAPRLLYDLISPREERGGHVEPAGLRGLEVEHQLVPGRRLHRKVGGFLASKDAINVAGCAAVLVDIIRTIGGQAAIGDVKARVVNRGQLVPLCQRDDQIAMRDDRRARCHDQTAVPRAHEGYDGT